jgi:hypothetical protein
MGCLQRIDNPGGKRQNQNPNLAHAALNIGNNGFRTGKVGSKQEMKGCCMTVLWIGKMALIRQLRSVRIVS